jgi:hypothetical protein
MTTEEIPPINWNDALLHLLNADRVPPHPGDTAAVVHSMLSHVLTAYEQAVAEEWTHRNGLGHPAAAAAAYRYYSAVEGLSAALAEALMRTDDLRNSWRLLASSLADPAAPEICTCPDCTDEDDDIVDHGVRH